MLGLPESTQVNIPLPKKALFEKFKLKTEDRRRFDSQISRMVIVAEIAPNTVNINEGEEVSSIFIIQVMLKENDCHSQNIIILSKLIDQKMLFLLQFEDKNQLAVYRNNRVLTSNWVEEPIPLELRGHNLDSVWEFLIASIGNLNLENGQSLNDAIDYRSRREHLENRILSLEKRVKAERQPRRKWDLSQELKHLKSELEEISHG